MYFTLLPEYLSRKNVSSLRPRSRRVENCTAEAIFEQGDHALARI